MASVELKNVSKSFGKVEAVRDVSLTISDREFVVFLGPSGCGKSTLLRMIAGLESVSSGELSIGGKPMNEVAAADRGIAMVFQSYALYPHMSVAENMGFALKMLGTDKAEIDRKVAETAAILQIEDLLTRRPRELSGGQRQRVAIGRAIVRKPEVFLFDEPLSNLDADLRAQMRVEIARLHRQLETTMIYVTHDQVEAMTLAERIVILNKGRVVQEGAPLDLHDRPANRFVAGFLGQPKMNFLPALVQRAGDAVSFRLAANGQPLFSIREGLRLPSGEAAEIGVRPNAISLSDNEGIAAETVLVERLGGTSLVHLKVEGLPRFVTVELQGKPAITIGSSVRFRFDPADAHVFDSQGRSCRL
ncbi:sn-glycerol-3-phosphate ABC transporter ATP-binding protein UgpC [Inquilinus limosus]|uniref:ABC transporter ATP-binding protein n=1 Tax=Inquilinus limosus TaxID=171674 RepID=UPI003F141251